MAGQGTLGIRQTARRPGRDARAVHGGSHVLPEAGPLSREEGCGVVFLHDEIHVDVVPRAA